MKVAPLATKAFQPFTITVETQAEADLLVALIGAVSDSTASIVGMGRDETYDIYLALKDFSTPRNSPFAVTLKAF